jgi:MFS-type transporter involved in bile tolerance (Atg22 family)
VSKPVLGLILGGILGIFDGLSALVSAPETAPDIVGIVIGSTFKGVLGGLIIGYFARKVRSLPAGLIFGGAIGLFLAFLVAAFPQPDGTHYWWEIMLPGTIVGLIVGYATQVYGRHVSVG